MEAALRDMVLDRFDSLTGLYERSAVEEFARRLVRENRPFSLFLIDGDNFKDINDGYGHSVGDKVICIIADKIRAAFADDGVVGRFGGDEFIVVLPDVVDYDAVWQSCRTCHSQFHDFSVPSYPSIFITITTGLSRFPNDGAGYEELFEKADKALYRGKTKGRSCFIIYLDEKHKNIKVHSSESAVSGSLQQHNSIFGLLSESERLAETIPALLRFFSVNLMIDHVGIQGSSDLLFSEVYSLSRGREFSHIDNALISLNINKNTSVFYMNNMKQLSSAHQDVLIARCSEQQIMSMFYAEISYGGTFYGYLRADSTSISRIWQHSDMDLLLTAAKAIGMMLHFQGKTLEDIAFSEKHVVVG